MAIIDKAPNAEGVVYPDRGRPEVPEGATCQEVLTMVAERYVRCGKPAVCIVDNGDQRAYWMCESCGYHNVQNRAGKLLGKVINCGEVEHGT